MKLFKKLWKKQEQCSNLVEVPRPDFFSFLKALYHKEPGYYAEYAAGTLLTKWQAVNDTPWFINFTDTDMTEEAKLYLALLYLKYKSPTTVHYPIAQDIVESYPDQSLVAKELMV